MPTNARLEVVLAPLELPALAQRDLRQTVCVVFDILRATSSMITALAHGAAAIVPVLEIDEAIAVYRERPGVLLAGERDGFRPNRQLTGGVDFHFGNSPRDFSPERVSGRTIVWTTTNGTRALRACARAQRVLVASFLNLNATAEWIQRTRPASLLLICSGTHDEAALEDVMAAGALCEEIGAIYPAETQADSVPIALRTYAMRSSGGLTEALLLARNGRRLSSLPELCDDVPACARRDVHPFAAEMREGQIVRLLE